MEYIIVFIIGIGLGWWINSWISAQAFFHILKDLNVPEEKIRALAERELSNEPEEEESTKTVIELKVEKVGDRLMAYRAEDDFFVAQGDDAAALIDALLGKYSAGYTVRIVEGGELVNDHVKSLKENG